MGRCTVVSFAVVRSKHRVRLSSLPQSRLADTVRSGEAQMLKVLAIVLGQPHQAFGHLLVQSRVLVLSFAHRATCCALISPLCDYASFFLVHTCLAVAGLHVGQFDVVELEWLKFSGLPLINELDKGLHVFIHVLCTAHEVDCPLARVGGHAAVGRVHVTHDAKRRVAFWVAALGEEAAVVACVGSSNVH